MALHINKTERGYALRGCLTSPNVHHLRSMLTYRLHEDQELKVYINELDQLDLSGAMMFRDLNQVALGAGLKLEIIVGDNQKIIGAFRMLEFYPGTIAA